MKTALVCIVLSILSKMTNLDQISSTTDDSYVIETTEISNITVSENATCDVINNTCEEYNLTTSTVASATKGNYDISIIKPSLTTLTPMNFKHKKNFPENEICTCDLEQSICDINCCCDEDCTYEDKLVFSTCETEPNRMFDTRYCKYSKFIYKNNTPYEWEVNQNGLFCIVKSNLPSEYNVHEQVKIRNPSDAQLQKINKYYWKPVKVIEEAQSFRCNETLRYGSYIWMIQNNSTLKILEIPDNFETSACLINKKAEFLKNMKSACFQTNFDDYNGFLDITTFITNISFVSLPKNVGSGFQNCSKSTIPLKAKICNDILEQCVDVRNSSSIYRYTCNFSLHYGNYNCQNLVKKLRYLISHNGTQGIEKVELLFTLSNETFKLLEKKYFLQEFEIRYSWTNKTLKYDSKRSGNPGYIIGKPILIGDLVHTNNTKQLTKNVTIRRSPFNVTNNFLTVPDNKAGNCIFSNETNILVEFGYNMIFTCKIKNYIKVENISSQEHCRKIQKFIFRFWKTEELYQNKTKVYGKFGNADVNNVNDWANITFSLKPELLLSDIKGNFSLNQSILQCQNLYDTLKMDIFHARHVVKKLQNQEKIIWLMFSFENRHNKSFNLINESFQFEFYLRFEVTFYDVTGKRTRKFADPPSLDIKLPYDFFYPFVRIDNKSDRGIHCNYCYLSISLVLSLMYFD